MNILLSEATFEDLINEIGDRFPTGYVFASLTEDESLKAPMNVYMGGHQVVRKGLSEFLYTLTTAEFSGLFMPSDMGEGE